MKALVLCVCSRDELVLLDRALKRVLQNPKVHLDAAQEALLSKLDQILERSDFEEFGLAAKWEQYGPDEGEDWKKS
jgi:hypothetical protein